MMRWLLPICLVLFILPGRSFAAEAAKATAEESWLNFMRAAEPSEPPKDWKEKPPTEVEKKKFRGKLGEEAEAAAALAKTFRETFPEHRKRKAAMFSEYRLLAIASYFGRTNATARLGEVKSALGREKLDEEDRFALESSVAARLESLFRANRELVRVEEVDKAVRKLASQFPKYEETFAFLGDLAKDYYAEDDFKTASAIAKEILAADAPESVDDDIKAMLKKIERLGKPVKLAFTALDGTKVDLEKLRGKVVLLQAWATWCPLCIEEMPMVKAVYQKLNPAGFEVIGLNFDSDKDELTKFLSKQKHVVWPQHFDGKGWDNKYGVEFEIYSLPALWLVDKKGVLRELNAQNDLEGKVRKLLAE